MAYNRLTKDQENAVFNLSPKLKELADDIFHAAQDSGSFHDSACDMLESGELNNFNNDEIRMVLETMGSWWE
tara:strand:+ start:850 stop:1065 length:216 start_codon:yes stop_codon:yes gene_type:complete